MLRRKSRTIPRRIEKVGSKYLLIDCSAVAYNAFYRFGSFNYNGEPVGVIYGFLRSILSLARRFDTNRFIFCWDWPGELYREQRYPNYKADREKKRKQMSGEDIRMLKEMLRQREFVMEEVLPELGFMNNHCLEYLEADDLLAWWAMHIFKRHGDGRSIIISSDNDLYQMLEYAPMYLMKQKKLFTKKDFFKKFGIHPNEWVKAKCIGGCSGDSVEGVKGIGDPKNPSSMALKYMLGTLGENTKAYKRITSRKGKKIRSKNYDLVSLPHPFYCSFGKPKMILRRDKFSTKKAIRLFDKYRFKSLLDEKLFKHWRRYFS